MVITAELINGLMLGFEVIWGQAVVLDLAVIRLVFHSNLPEE